METTIGNLEPRVRTARPVRLGWGMTAVPALFLAFDVVIRLGDPFLSHTSFPVLVGAFPWLGLGLRDAWVRALFLSTTA
jgi:hypothetical protein